MQRAPSASRRPRLSGASRLNCCATACVCGSPSSTRRRSRKRWETPSSAPTPGGKSVNEDDVISTVLERLESLGIPYMVVGSYASNAYGRPRGSFDADVVVGIAANRVQPLLDAFKADFVVGDP